MNFNLAAPFARPDALIVDRAGLACLSDRIRAVAPLRILTSEPPSPACPAGVTSFADLPDPTPQEPIAVADEALARLNHRPSLPAINFVA
jgi:hypothetical protein